MTTKLKPALASGTRDFLPAEVIKRNYLKKHIQTVFEKYGYQPIETPTFESLATLTGKYGDEGEQLLFKILNQGDFLKNVSEEMWSQKKLKEVVSKISERGLRYDLTVPLARYVVMNQNDLTFPFKRYHIAPVFRGDRPQRGRYREFYQCDADVIGSDSILNEVEQLCVYSEVFKNLGINSDELQRVEIVINHRTILRALIQKLAFENEAALIGIIDKFDKIGWEGIAIELQKMDFSTAQIDIVNQYLKLTNETTNEQVIQQLEIQFSGSEEATIGIRDLKKINSLLSENKVKIKIDTTLARGLSYYTGMIVEVRCLPEFIQMGSVGGGGRYANLTEQFGGQNMSGMGISFGFDRIYILLEELQLFPSIIQQGVQVLVVPRDENVQDYSFSFLQKLHANHISAELFLGNIKKQKQYSFAESKNISFIIELGEQEMQTQQFRLRNVQARKEEGAGFDWGQLIAFLKK